jgi:hypothetical protein
MSQSKRQSHRLPAPTICVFPKRSDGWTVLANPFPIDPSSEHKPTNFAGSTIVDRSSCSTRPTRVHYSLRLHEQQQQHDCPTYIPVDRSQGTFAAAPSSNEDTTVVDLYIYWASNSLSKMTQPLTDRPAHLLRTFAQTFAATATRSVTTLQETLAAQVPEKQKKMAALKKEHGEKVYVDWRS